MALGIFNDTKVKVPIQVDYSSDGEPVYFVRDTPAGSTLDTLKLQCLDMAGRPVPPGTAGRAWIAARDSAAVQQTWSELPDCVFDDSGCALPPLKVRSHECSIRVKATLL